MSGIVCNRMTLIPMAAAATVFTAAAFAGPTYNSHFGISVGDNGELVTQNWISSQGGYQGPSRLFAFNLHPDGFWDVGTNSTPGTFAYPGAIGFSFIGALQVWNGSGFDSATNTMTVQFGPDSATSGAGEVEGFATSVRSPETGHPETQWGRHHVHSDYFLTGGPPQDGIYMIEMTLWYEPGAGNAVTYGASESFWAIFNHNQSESDVLLAKDWVQLNLIPAPGVLALLALAGFGGRRRRTVGG